MQKLLSKLLIENSLLTIYEIPQKDYPRLFELMEKYKDRPMDLADATLVLASERLGVKDILTIDKDFYIYRIYDSECFNVLSL